MSLELNPEFFTTVTITRNYPRNILSTTKMAMIEKACINFPDNSYFLSGSLKIVYYKTAGIYKKAYYSPGTYEIVTQRISKTRMISILFSENRKITMNPHPDIVAEHMTTGDWYPGEWSTIYDFACKLYTSYQKSNEL